MESSLRPSFQTILRIPIQRGRFLTATDDHASARVCVLGSSMARRLFGHRLVLVYHRLGAPAPAGCEIVPSVLGKQIGDVASLMAALKTGVSKSVCL